MALIRKIPVIPVAVNAVDLHHDFFLMSASERALLQEKLDVSQNRRYTKEELNAGVLPGAKYSVLAHNGELYILYKGEKTRRNSRVGYIFIVKYVQHIKTGAWLVLKIASKTHFGQIAATDQYVYQNIKRSRHQRVHHPESVSALAWRISREKKSNQGLADIFYDGLYWHHRFI